MKKVAFHNLGCKVNSYELDGIQQIFQKAGYEIVDFAQKADIYIVNTCSVTNIADRKSRQMLHKAKAENPDALVVALGCFVQADPQKAAKDEAIDIIIGNNKKTQTLDIVEEYLRCPKGSMEDGIHKCDIHAEDLTDPVNYENMSIAKTAEHTRAFIKIQDGCNQFCSYCIIPYVRGRIRSRDISDIVSEVENLRDNGYKEVVLTGIHLSSYGIEKGSYNEKALEGFTNYRLLDVIKRVCEIDGIKRVRLGSLEPRLITEEFIAEIKKQSKVCPHFHLSLQSGCDDVLKRMNRHYTTKEYEEVVRRIREAYDRPAVTTDVIVGFPGESKEEFLRTQEYLRQINLYETHLFKYSRRAKTVADKMPAQHTDKTKSLRAAILAEDDRIRRNEFAGLFIGDEVEILLEDEEFIEGKAVMVGYTPQYVKCAVELCRHGEKNLSGEIIKAKGSKVIDGVLLCEKSLV